MRERRAGRLRTWARLLVLSSGASVVLAAACGFAAADGSAPKYLWAVLAAGAVVLWFAGQVLHIRAAVERDQR